MANFRNIRGKVETALAAYVEDNATGTALAGLPVVRGQEEARKEEAPAVFVTVTETEYHVQVADCFRVVVQAAVMTNAHDESADTHQARVGALADLLGEPAALMSALNKPAFGADSRTVTELHVIGVVPQALTTVDDEEVFLDAWVAEVFCHGWDATVS